MTTCAWSRSGPARGDGGTSATRGERTPRDRAVRRLPYRVSPRVLTVLLAAATSLSAPAARCQMFAAPVLQNAFANPGVTLGLDAGSGDGGHSYGAALAWGDASHRVQLSGGLAAFLPTSSGSAYATWGARLMVPIPRVGTPDLRVAGVVGVGGLSMGGVARTRIPVGVTVGWRHAMGGHRVISVYATPLFEWSRVKVDSLSQGHGLVRLAVGMDIALTSRLGLTAGLETGARAPAGQPGPTGELFGIGMSYALRRPR